MLAIMISRYTGNYNFRNISNHMFRNAGDNFDNSFCFRKWRRMLTSMILEILTIIILRNAGDKCWQLFVRKWRRMLTTIFFRNDSNYNFQKCGRQMIANFRNAGDEG